MNARLCASAGVIVTALFLSASASPAAPPPEIKPQLVTFTSAGAQLHGFLYLPPGKGPFPAVVYNHGSDRSPGWFPTLGKFWTEHGFAFFVPHRPGHGRSPGDWIVEVQRQYREKEKDKVKCQQHDIELHEQACVAVVDAVNWLKQQPSECRHRICRT